MFRSEDGSRVFVTRASDTATYDFAENGFSVAPSDTVDTCGSARVVTVPVVCDQCFPGETAGARLTSVPKDSSGEPFASFVTGICCLFDRSQKTVDATKLEDIDRKVIRMYQQPYEVHMSMFQEAPGKILYGHNARLEIGELVTYWHTHRSDKVYLFALCGLYERGKKCVTAAKRIGLSLGTYNFGDNEIITECSVVRTPGRRACFGSVLPDCTWDTVSSNIYDRASRTLNAGLNAESAVEATGDEEDFDTKLLLTELEMLEEQCSIIKKCYKNKGVSLVEAYINESVAEYNKATGETIPSILEAAMNTVQQQPQLVSQQQQQPLQQTQQPPQQQQHTGTQWTQQGHQIVPQMTAYAPYMPVPQLGYNGMAQQMYHPFPQFPSYAPQINPFQHGAAQQDQRALNAPPVDLRKMFLDTMGITQKEATLVDIIYEQIKHKFGEQAPVQPSAPASQPRVDYADDILGNPKRRAPYSREVPSVPRSTPESELSNAVLRELADLRRLIQTTHAQPAHSAQVPQAEEASPSGPAQVVPVQQLQQQPSTSGQGQASATDSIPQACAPADARPAPQQHHQVGLLSAGLKVTGKGKKSAFGRLTEQLS